jgi:hypothetical protein
VTQPWDQEPGESSRWYARFERYRQLGHTRSVDAVFREEKRTEGRRHAPGRWHTEAARWHWKERAAAWDDYQREIARKEEEQELRKRRKEHIAQALKLQELGVQGTQHLKPEVFTVADVIKLLEVGVRLELLGRGAPSEITEERRRELPAEQVDDNTLARIALEGSEDAATLPDDPQATLHVQDAAEGKSEPGNGIPAE